MRLDLIPPKVEPTVIESAKKCPGKDARECDFSHARK